jgi:hypothetical protein
MPKEITTPTKIKNTTKKPSKIKEETLQQLTTTTQEEIKKIFEQSLAKNNAIYLKASFKHTMLAVFVIKLFFALLGVFIAMATY